MKRCAVPLCEKAQYYKDRILLRLNLLQISTKNSNVIFSGNWHNDFNVYLED